MEWQDISTAPDDPHIEIDLWLDHDGAAYRIPDCHRRLCGNGWIDEHGNIIGTDWPTHWMLPPDPPSGEQS